MLGSLQNSKQRRRIVNKCTFELRPREPPKNIPDKLTHPNHPFRTSFQALNREHETTPKLMTLVGAQQKKASQKSPTRHCAREAALRATSLGHLGHLVLQQIWRATMSYSTFPACPATWGSNWRGASDAKQPLVCFQSTSQLNISFLFSQCACPWTSLLQTLSQ